MAKTPQVVAMPGMTPLGATPKAARTGDANISTVCIVAMAFKKETPGTYVYASDDPDAAITQLYIRKSAMPKGSQPTISVTVHGA